MECSVNNAHCTPSSMGDRSRCFLLTLEGIRQLVDIRFEEALRLFTAPTIEQKYRALRVAHEAALRMLKETQARLKQVEE